MEVLRAIGWGLRVLVAAFLGATAVAAAVLGWRWPLEGGGILFAPALFTVSMFALFGAVALRPWRR